MRKLLIMVLAIAAMMLIAIALSLGTFWWTMFGAPQRYTMASATARADARTVGHDGLAARCIEPALVAGSHNLVADFMLSCLDEADSPEMCVESTYEPEYEQQQERIARFCERQGRPNAEPCSTVGAAIDLWCHSYAVRQLRTRSSSP